eukprot:CAMPEP_0182936006 /NCGR_PEP_ID=MMETSP0105_2-20130417/39386_1 /TAXON_ID=81532 ORGANISM="Acanthoeca-like sp., Strain 10tr" /NCGR_SAMPLE_ID=MMETSP0105_2 /ASSEMBLY_ACC=CAM_ASM_000205 /LENGTH=56 /DNA_ID=CAMNT_0025075057 /DNA_START=45 /DNA_END=212 /DNA_ORIENTATION=-
MMAKIIARKSATPMAVPVVTVAVDAAASAIGVHVVLRCGPRSLSSVPAAHASQARS